MDTDFGSSPSPLPLSADSKRELGETLPHTNLAVEMDKGNLNPKQSSDEPALHPDATSTEELRSTNTNTNATTDANDNQQSTVTSPVAFPPYWTALNCRNYPSGHGRTHSNISTASLIPGGLGITLRDNESSSADDRGCACWAKSVELTDYVTVNGSKTNIGAFVVWNIRVETLNGSYMNIRKRYSEFEDFRWRLMQTFPSFEAAVPELPPKNFLSKFRPSFLEKRRVGLQYFLNCIMLNPEFSGSPVLKEFLFS
ncbi:Phox homologous domain-containing protein [Xylaria intraflava]|nr:Phox homologous domain-containing protein [Xylaria intraflava]